MDPELLVWEHGFDKEIYAGRELVARCATWGLANHIIDLHNNYLKQIDK